MHKLTRPDPPSCLTKYDHGRGDTWDKVDNTDKDEIWIELNEMQKSRCAYCEYPIDSDKPSRNAHIEHFRQRSRCPSETFLWSNLFGSCNRQDSCGKHKDTLKPYDDRDLIKMDDEDPEALLRFLPDGTVVHRSELDDDDTKRAQETIRIFNLNGSLRKIRETMVKGYLQTAEKLAECADDFDEEEWLLILEEELNEIRDLPFATAIKHVLLPY